MSEPRPLPYPPVESPRVQALIDMIVIAQRRKWEREEKSR